MCLFWVGNGLMYLFECVKVMTWVWSCMMGYGLVGVMIWVWWGVMGSQHVHDGVVIWAWWGREMGVATGGVMVCLQCAPYIMVPWIFGVVEPWYRCSCVVDHDKWVSSLCCTGVGTFGHRDIILVLYDGQTVSLVSKGHLMYVWGLPYKCRKVAIRSVVESSFECLGIVIQVLRFYASV